MPNKPIVFALPCIVLPKGNVRNPRVVNGKIKGFYESKKSKANDNELITLAWPYRPEKPIEGPIRVSYVFSYPYRKGDKDRDDSAYCYKLSKPDLGQLEKRMDDILKKARFINDDAQIVERGHSGRYWRKTGGIGVSIVVL